MKHLFVYRPRCCINVVCRVQDECVAETQLLCATSEDPALLTLITLGIVSQFRRMLKGLSMAPSSIDIKYPLQISQCSLCYAPGVQRMLFCECQNHYDLHEHMNSPFPLIPRGVLNFPHPLLACFFCLSPPVAARAHNRLHVEQQHGQVAPVANGFSILQRCEPVLVSAPPASSTKLNPLESKTDDAMASIFQ